MKKIKICKEEYEELLRKKDKVQEAENIIERKQEILSEAIKNAEKSIRTAENEAMDIIKKAEEFRNSVSERAAEIQLKKIREDYPEIDCHFADNDVYQGKKYFRYNPYGSGGNAGSAQSRDER